MKLTPWRDFQLAFTIPLVAFVVVGILVNPVAGFGAAIVSVPVYDKIAERLGWVEV